MAVASGAPFGISGAGLTDAERSAELVKLTTVFGVRVLATEVVEDRDLLLAANVLAQWLDNDEDGRPDNAAVHRQLLRQRCCVVLHLGDWFGEHGSKLPDPFHTLDVATINHAWYGMEPGAYSRSPRPGRLRSDLGDATTEETFHMISDLGYGAEYPDAFGRSETTETALSKAMDRARGGKFFEVPSEYPDGAWYAYGDTGCSYICQMSEYIHWGLITLLGLNERRTITSAHSERQQWTLATARQLRETDPGLFALLTEPEYRFPTVAPDGRYRAGSSRL